MNIQVANPERMAIDAMIGAWQPPPPVDYLQWAKDNVVFSERESPLPGPFNVDRFPHLVEIFRALSPDDPCRIVTVKGSAQIGKTVVGNIFTGGSQDLDPCDFLVVHPTEENAGRWSKLKLSPFLKGTTCLRALFPERSRDGTNSVLLKERIDGRGAILISGANSPASLSQVTMRRQFQDDVSKWDMNSAGDPESQADSRSRAHDFAKILKASTPLIVPGCRITKDFEAGSQEYPYVPCPHCQHMQVLEWENMLANLDPDHPERAHFTCVACGCEIRDHHRPAMLARLEFRAHNPRAIREHRSFWIWSAYIVLQSFAQIAREYLAAKGDAERERVFANDTCGVAYKAKGEAPPWETLRDRAAQSHYPIGEIPVGALLLTLGIDCQIDRVEWQLVGWGREFRRYVIAYGVIPGHIMDAGCQEKLDALIAQTWRNAAGRQIGADLAAIDGNAWTEDVWAWAKRHPKSKVIMVRGRPEETAPRIARVKKERNERTGKLLKYSSRFYNFGASILKHGLYRDLAKEDPAKSGYVSFPRGLDDEYFRQLTAERREAVKKHGFESYRWVKDPAQANEALDTMNQAETAATKLGVRGMPDQIWARLETEREAPLVPAQGDIEDLLSPTVPATVPPARRPRRRRVTVRQLT